MVNSNYSWLNKAVGGIILFSLKKKNAMKMWWPGCARGIGCQRTAGKWVGYVSLCAGQRLDKHGWNVPCDLVVFFDPCIPF